MLFRSSHLNYIKLARLSLFLLRNPGETIRMNGNIIMNTESGFQVTRGQEGLDSHLDFDVGIYPGAKERFQSVNYFTTD